VTLFETLTSYAGRGAARFHMPGHKGVLPRPFDSVAKIDVTELDTTGDLYYESDGAIRRSERGMAALFGAKDCLYLTGGATQGVFTALASAVQPGGTVNIWRGCHRSVHNALALLDLRPVWFWDAPEAPAPVFYTSPDYYGRLYPRPDTGGLTLCDAAHGAHLPFCLPEYTPPGNLWVASAHKTLGVLGQSAMLLSDGMADPELLREQSSVFGTASPSFVLLASLDAGREELEKNGRESWARVAAFSGALAKRDGRVFVQDPAKVTVTTGDGLSDASRLAREFSVVCEAADKDRLVFMLSPHNTDEEFVRLERALASIPLRNVRPQPERRYEIPQTVMTPREAFFAPRERVSLRGSAGRVAARVFAPSPPGVPFFSPGELIDKKTLEIISEMCYTVEETIWVVR
jgi:lysine decarboxylase